MYDIDVKQLLEAGVHFGHQTSRWNPKMKPFIFTARHGVHIVDLEKTAQQLKEACKFLADKVALGESMIFVGTKKQASLIVRTEAARVGAFYIDHRWLGGMMTNFKTVKQSIDRFQKMCKQRDDGSLDKLPKKEGLGIIREIAKYEKTLGGIKTMSRLPGIVFVVDPKKEHIAQHEANVLGIPVIALTDTNCDPDEIDFVIPGNDDALRSIQLVVKIIADAYAEGMERRQAVIREEVEAEAKGKAEGQAIREVTIEGKAKAYVAREDKRRPSENSSEAGVQDAEKYATTSARANTSAKKTAVKEETPKS